MKVFGSQLIYGRVHKLLCSHFGNAMIANGKQSCAQVKLKIMTVQSTVILVIIIIINTYVWYFLYDKMASLPIPIDSENVFVLPVAVSDEIVSCIGALLLSVSPIHYTIIPWLIFDCYLLGLRRE